MSVTGEPVPTRPGHSFNWLLFVDGQQIGCECGKVYKVGTSISRALAALTEHARADDAT